MPQTAEPKIERRSSMDASALEDQWAMFKEVVVGVAKPMLKEPWRSGDITKEVYKQVLKKTADKVVGGYRKEGLSPPRSDEDMTQSQRTKIEKLTLEYMEMLK